MNPSTEDIMNAVDKVNADTIFVLPNNKNIILAAEQAKSLVEDKNLIVIPSKTVPQGITAIVNYIDGETPEVNAEHMTGEMGRVKTGQVTYAVRDTVLDNKTIKEGDIMGIGDDGILSVCPDIDEATEELIDALVDEDSELICIYYGEDITSEGAEELAARIEEKYPDVDVELQEGGQPIYYYVLSVE